MPSLLKTKKISETPFRLEVLDIFESNKNAIPLSVIEKELQSYNRITLYRTIKVFLEKGIIHEITISGEDSNYALCVDQCESDSHQHDHVHFKCNQCGIISCVEVDNYPALDLPGYQVEQTEIQMSGKCLNC
ncbi:MAG: transcriptional repressor [Flavobacteriales bacterium]